MLKKIVLLLVLLFVVMVLSGAEQTTGLIFEGKIQEISSKTTLTPTSKENFLVIKLDSKPNVEFRLTAADGARFGLIETKGPSPIITPGRVKGLGWKVRLTCDKQTFAFSNPIYMVTNLERLD
jgi:hypothetical protein